MAFALTAGLVLAASAGGLSYFVFGSGTVGPPHTARAAALRYAHLLRGSEARDMGLVVCAGVDSQVDTLGGLDWRLNSRLDDSTVTSFSFVTSDRQRQMRVDTGKVGNRWCVSAVTQI
jgi:hypothetical protein